MANKTVNDCISVFDTQSITIDLPPQENSEGRQFIIKNLSAPLEEAIKEQNPTLPERIVYVNAPGLPSPLFPSESATLIAKREGKWEIVE